MKTLKLYCKRYQVVRALFFLLAVFVGCSIPYVLKTDDASLPNPSVLIYESGRPNQIPRYSGVSIDLVNSDSTRGARIWTILSETRDPSGDWPESIKVPNPLIIGQVPAGFKTVHEFKGLESGNCYNIDFDGLHGGGEDFNFCVENDLIVIEEKYRAPGTDGENTE